MDKAASELSAGQYRAAEIELKNVLQKQPDNARAWLLLGRVSLASGQDADAAEQLRRARTRGAEAKDLDVMLGRALIGTGKYDEVLSELSPGESVGADEKARLLALRGEAYLGKQQMQDAGQAFDSALALSPDLAVALIGKARLAQANGNDETARKFYDQAVSKNPSDATARQAQAIFVYNQNQCPAAIGLFQTLLNQEKNGLTPLQAFLSRAYMADCMLREQRLSDAEHEIAILMKQGPENPYANYLQSLVDVRHKDYEQATVHLQRLLKSAPDSTRGLLLLASVKLAQDDPEPAELYLNDVLTQQPDNARAIGLLAGLYLKQGRSERAIKLLQDAHARDVDNPKIRAMLAEAMVRAAKDDNAAGYRNDLTRPAGMDADLKLDLARAVAQSGKSAAALTLLDQVASEDAGEQFKATALKIALLLRQKQPDEAVAQAEKLQKASPKDAQTVQLLASTYVAAGQVDKARTVLRDVLKNDADNIDVRVELGLLNLRVQDKDGAQEQFRAVLARAPNDSRAMMGMARLASQRGETQSAIQWLEKAHMAEPTKAAIGVALVKAYLTTRQPVKAMPVIDALVQQDSANPALRRLQGITQLAAKHNDQGLSALEAAADMAADRPAYRLDLARALLALKKNDEALEQLEKLRKNHPDYMPAVPPLIVTQLRLGKPDAALATADSVADQPQGELPSETLKGDVFAAEGEYEKAVSAYAKVYDAAPSAAVARSLFEARRRGGDKNPQRSLEDWLNRKPDDVGVALTLAQWYQANEHVDAAVRTYRSVLDNDADNVVALNNLAVLYSQQQDSQALSMAKRAHQAAPDNLAIIDTLGWIQVQAGNLVDGLPLLHRAAKANNAPPAIEYHLAFALAHTDKDEDRIEARKILQRLLATGGDFENKDQAQALLNKLNSPEASAAND